VNIRNTSKILNHVHSNEIIKTNFNKIIINEGLISLDGYANFNLELIRFIEILIFENEYRSRN
jgi:hypothetical protein